MQVTRLNHTRYMAKVTPFLIVLYLLQAFIYQRFAPAPLASDINLFLGVGLALLIMGYQFYDHHHRIIFHHNYLEVRFDLFKIKEEILYQNISWTEIRTQRQHYGHIVIYQRDGSHCHLLHVDSPEHVVEFIERKRSNN